MGKDRRAARTNRLSAPDDTVVEQLPWNWIRARRASGGEAWGEGRDEASAKVGLALAVQLVSQQHVGGLGESAEVRYDALGDLDEILTAGAIHLERLDDHSFYLDAGTLHLVIGTEDDRVLRARLVSADQPLAVRASYDADSTHPLPEPKYWVEGTDEP